MKVKIRTQSKVRRKALSDIDRERKSHRIFGKLLSIPEVEASKNIMVYISATEEVVTHFMVKRLLHSNKTLYVPKVIDQQLIACRLDPLGS